VPKVALVWINYNSSHMRGVVRESLRSLYELNYPSSDYEVIVIDNASTDGSWEFVRDLAREYSRRFNVRTVIYRSSRNLMYTGGNELGLRLMSRGVNYVGFINNDVIAHPDSLSSLIEYLRTYEEVGAVQGILYYDRRGKYVNSAGCFIDTLLNCHMVSTPITKPLSVTYTHGAYSVYSLKALKKILHNGRLFFQCVPAFFDDNYIGMRLWNSGYMSCALPVNAGTHLHSATFKRLSLLRDVNSFRTSIVKGRVITLNYQSIYTLYIVKRVATLLRRLDFRLLIRTYLEATECGDFIVKSLGCRLSIDKIPHIPLSINEIIKVILGAGRSVYSKFLDGNYVLSRACLKDLCPK